MRVGIDSWCQELAAVSTVASAAMMAHRDLMDYEVSEMQRLHVSPVIFRHYDCTPVRVFFGRALSVGQPHARFLHYDDASGKWKRLTLEQYRAVGGRAVGRGLLELLAEGIHCRWLNDDGTMFGLRCLVPPLFIQNGKKQLHLQRHRDRRARVFCGGAQEDGRGRMPICDYQ